MLFSTKDYYEFKWSDLWDFKYRVEIGVDAFKLLAENQEDSLKATKDKFDALVENELKDLTPDMQGSYYGQFFASEAHAIDELTRQQRYALCLSIFAFFEGILGELCKSVEGKAPFKIRLEDLNNRNDLRQYWTYLTKVLEIDKSDVERFFTPVNQQKRTRNAIAHNQGIVFKKEDIHLVTGLRLEKYGDKFIVEITALTYVHDLLKNIAQFFKKLLIEVDRRFIALNSTRQAAS